MDETLVIDGINICYDLSGSGEPVILIHGLGVGRTVWNRLAEDASKLFTVYSVDLPGFGCSDAPDLPYGVPFYVEFLLKFMDEANINRATIVGSSMGGRVAALFAAKYPERISKLVLIAPGGLTPSHSRLSDASWLMDANFWLMSKNRALYRKSFEDSFADTEQIPEWLVDQGWSMMKNPAYRRAFLRNAQYLSRPDPAFKDALGLIKAETLIIWGTEDHVIPSSDAKKFADLIKHSEVRILEKCGHMVLLECGNQCNDLILSFIGEEDLYYASEEM